MQPGSLVALFCVPDSQPAGFQYAIRVALAAGQDEEVFVAFVHVQRH